MLRVVAAAIAVSLCAWGWSLTELIDNPSLGMDQNADGVADGWAANVHTTEGAAGTFAIDAHEKRSGAGSQRIDHTSDNAAWVRVSQEPIEARAGETYRLSAWARTTGRYSIVLYEFRTGGLDYLTHYLVADAVAPEWQHHRATITTSREARFFKLSLIASARGTVWFDDVSLVRVAERPRIRCPFTDQAPQLDGVLEDAAWQGAARADSFAFLGAAGEPASPQTHALMTRDDRAVYIALKCDEPNVAGLVRDTVQDAHTVWSDDVVEIFIDLNQDQSGYLHLGVSAGGGKWQERVATTRWYSDWYSFRSQTGPEPRWQAAVSVGADAWSVELALPFDQVGGPPPAGQAWGLQFARTRRASGGEEHSTWSYTDGDRFAVPARFGSVVFSGAPASAPEVVRVTVDADTFRPTIVPLPRDINWTGDVFRISAQTVIHIASPDQRPEAELLRSDLAARFGVSPTISEGPRCPAKGAINLSAAPDRATPEDPEGYGLEVDADLISIRARGPRGRLYAVQTLRQMLGADGTPFCPSATIVDSPDLQWRAWHMASPPAPDLEAYRRMVDTLSLLKFNTIVWEVNSQLQYESHPKIAATTAPTKEQLRELVEYAKLRRFEVIPQFASFSHFGFVLQHPEYRHLAESQETQFGRRSLFNYCPSQEESYEVTFDLMAEIAEVFQPKYFHIGHDESSFDDIGVCERCRDTEPWKLWARDINRLDKWITERNMRTIMWGDQLLPSHNGSDRFQTARATDAVSRDILIFDWHYSFNHPYDETIQYFKSRGFEVVGCPWYEVENAYRYASAAKRNEILGYCGTTWSRVAGRTMPHMLAAWVIGAENCWTVDKPTLAEIDYQPVAQFHRLQRFGHESLPREFRLLDISSFANERTVDTRRRDGWMGAGPDYDLSALPGGVVHAGEIPFKIAASAQQAEPACIMLADQTTREGAYPEAVEEIPLGLTTTDLFFLHTCNVPEPRARHLYTTENPRLIGRYVIHYADGEQVAVPLQYQANISDWNSQRGPAQSPFLWQSRTGGGALATLGIMRWINPRPDVPLRSLDFISAVQKVRPVLLAVTAAGE